MIEDEDLRVYYKDRLAMMDSQGWKDLISDAKKMYEATNNINNVQDEKTLHFRRGELSIMNWLITLEDMSRMSINQNGGL